jgi:hypothetical protein
VVKVAHDIDGIGPGAFWKGKSNARDRPLFCFYKSLAKIGNKGWPHFRFWLLNFTMPHKKDGGCAALEYGISA